VRQRRRGSIELSRTALVRQAGGFHADCCMAFHKHKNLSALYRLHAPLAVLPEYVTRYAVIDGAKRLFGFRRNTWATS
jgi:hypothetical protein